MAALSKTAACVLAALLAAGCHAGRPGAPTHRAAPGDDITLYRDVALVRQRITVELPSTPTTITAHLAAGVDADQISVIDRGGLDIRGVHAQTHAPADEIDEGVGPTGDESEGASDEDARPRSDADSDRMAGTLTRHYRIVSGSRPTAVRLDVMAPRPGTYSLVLGYTTDKLRWDVAYTMTANERRDRGELRGALAIRNETGIVLHAEHARVVDAELAAWRTKTAEHLAASLVGGTHGSTLPAAPRELGPVELAAGETRVDLTHDVQRRMRSLLVYDPIGTKLDNPGPAPLRDHDLGIRPKASSKVTESFEVARDVRGTSGLPGGPVRLLDRRANGSLGVLGEARLFDAATRVSEVDTIAIGTAADVTGTRERREITVD
jgi:hypothetical protein